MIFRQEFSLRKCLMMLLWGTFISTMPLVAGYSQEKSLVFSYKYALNEKYAHSDDYVPSDSYRIEAQNAQTIYLNGQIYQADIQIQNNIIVKILERNSDDFKIYYDVETIEDEQLLSTQDSTFTQYRHGLMVVPSYDEVPFVRSIPKFPLTPVSVGEKWQSLGQENILLPEANEYILTNINVNYTYLGIYALPRDAIARAQEKGKILLEKAPLIQIEYSIDNRTFFNPNINEYQTVDSSYDIKLWWNQIESRIEYYEEHYIIDVAYQEEDTIRFSGKAHAMMLPIERLDKSIEQLQDELNNSVEDVEISNNEKGITLSLQNINFKANSAELEQSELEKLTVIANILLRYKDRRFLVEGHTALAGTEENRQSLSNARAKAVLQILQELSLINKEQFIYRGWGAEQPIGSNYTEEGKAKNRRVEITILEN